MKEIKAEELQKNPFSMIGKEWMLDVYKRQTWTRNTRY